MRVPLSGAVGLGVRVQHQFMVWSYGYYMTSKTLASDLRARLLAGDQESCRAVCRAKEGVDSVNTYVCFMALPGLSLDRCNCDDIPGPNIHHFEALTGRHTGSLNEPVSLTHTAVAAQVR
jgi:hypothetical protein